MTLEFRDHQVLVISPGSGTTQVQMGLTESLMPPAFELPSVVYKDAGSGKFRSFVTDGAEAVLPIVRGAIVNEEAFLYLLKVIYKSVSPLDGLPPAVYLVASLAWTRRQTERIVQYMFEEVGVPALTVSLHGLVTSYAFSITDGLIIDVGLDKTEIGVIIGSEENRNASSIVPKGGNSVNEAMQKVLPNFSPNQIEDLKKSDIYEVLNDAQHEANSNNQQLIDEDDGVVDIAAIVASGRTREILDLREKQKHGELQDVANADLPTNRFEDRNGESIEVGRERFLGTDDLIAAIVDEIADVIYALNPREQEHVFENVVITGKGSLIEGFRNRVAEKIEERYVIKPRGSAGVIAATEDLDSPTQGPTVLTLARLPDHFPEWKNRKWEDFAFLGAQIAAKQVFTTGMEGIFTSRQDYNDVGPSSIWDVFN